MANRSNRVVLACALLACAVGIAPAMSSGAGVAAKPTAQMRDVQPIDAVATLTASLYDRSTIDTEDVLREQQGLPPRFAIANYFNATPITDGTWEDVGDGLMMWRLHVSAAGAKSINLGFTRYNMTPGGQMFLYSSDLSSVVRPFTSEDNAEHGELWSPIIPGESVIIEVTIPADEVTDLDLELGAVNVGYRGFNAKADDGGLRSGSCNVDVVCPEGDLWRDQIQSSALFTINGTWTCSGAMINNTAFDRTPYFLTANHCGVNSGNDSAVVIYFNFQNSTCRPPGSGQSGGAGDGSLSQFHSGTIHRASYSNSDFTLIELDSTPDPAFDIYYSGWDRSSNDATSAVAIHHPNTDEKRISFEYQPTSTASYLGSSAPGDGTHVRIADWDLGTTEPGSSGSPLYDQNHRIIGQLHGGYAACGNNDSDWYGRVSVSWNGGGSASSRLSDWLDPLGTGATAIDGTGLDEPPVTQDVDVELLVNSATTITLVGSDANNQSIDFIITSLPAHGELTDTLDPGAGSITAVPYTLSGGGNQVDFKPSSDYLGSDSFTFKANDGGVPPDGGDSNTSAVSLDIIENPPVITTATLPDGAVGQPYGPVQLQADAGQPALLWQLITDVPYVETDLGTSGFAQVGVAQAWNGDDKYWTYTLPFSFPFFNGTYSSVRVWSNGFLNFGVHSGGSYANSDQVLIDNVRIAPMWDDLKTNQPGNDIFIDESVSGAVTIRWNAATYNGSHPCNFAVTLFDDGGIEFHYGPGNDPITATVGVSAGDGSRYTFASYNPATALTGANSIRFQKLDQLSPGLSVSPAGVLSGTPQMPGDYLPLFRVTDNLARSDEAFVPLHIAAAFGDFDLDGDVDLGDYQIFHDCMTGPNAGPYGAGCAPADTDADGDVDLEDFAAFSAALPGI